MALEISVEQINGGALFAGDAVFPGVNDGVAVLLASSQFVRKTELDGLVADILVPPAPVALTASAALGLNAVGATVTMTSSSATSITIANDSAVAWPDGAEIFITREGTGDVSIVPSSGVTLRTGGGKDRINLQFDSVIVRRIGANKWALLGALKA